MGRAELNFLFPLFELANSLTDEADVPDMAIGLGSMAPDSPLARDDRDLDGYWVSAVINSSIVASLDHVVTLRELVLRDGEAMVTVSAPWTLLRGCVEAAAVGLWVAEPTTRQARRARALRVWHYDFTERQKWESDTGRVPTGKAKSGADRAKSVVALAGSLGIKATSVATPLAYSDCVVAAASGLGRDRTEARARWREASAFAHGRYWPQLALTSAAGAVTIPGGYGMQLVLNEERLALLADLAHALLNGAVLRFAELAASAAD